MEKKLCTVEELERAKKKAEFRESVWAKLNGAKDWCINNKEFVVGSIPVIYGVVSKVVKSANKHSTLSEEKRLKENYCYDRSLGHYWELRRKLTNNEWTEIERRKRNGERLGDILDSMRVLKK